MPATPDPIRVMVLPFVVNFIPVGAFGAAPPVLFAEPAPEEETLVTLNFGTENEISEIVTRRPSVPLSAAVHLLHVTVSVPASVVDFDSAVRATLSTLVISVSVVSILNCDERTASERKP